jgi:hypothetical protein
MTVLNDTNRGRVAKMVETVALIEKSALSNKASQEDLWALLSPIVDAIQLLLDAEARPNDAPAEAGDGLEAEEPTIVIQHDKPLTGQKPARWFTIYQLAQEAPLDELTRAMAVFLNRVDELLADERKAG